jgi:hypothetical protein
MERFASADAEGTDTAAMQNSQTHDIELALATLPPRDAKVLRLYFGLDDGNSRTLEEIGRMMGVTRERIRQLRDRALLIFMLGTGVRSAEGPHRLVEARGGGHPLDVPLVLGFELQSRWSHQQPVDGRANFRAAAHGATPAIDSGGACDARSAARAKVFLGGERLEVERVPAT